MASQQAKLPDADPQNLSNIVLACSHLLMIPPGAWLLEYWKSSRPLLASCNGQDLSNMLLGLAYLRISPPPEWLTHFWTCAEQLALGVDAMRFTSQGQSMLRDACRRLELPPPTWPGA